MAKSKAVTRQQDLVEPYAVQHLPAANALSALRLAPGKAKLLPIRPRPYPQELLSSWLFRLAQGNTQKLHSLTKMLVGERQVWNRDIDRLADDGLLLVLEGATGVSVEQLRLHTLGALTGKVYHRFTTKTNNRWILPLGVYHRTRKLRGLMYCPHCLREQAGFLMWWRLSISVVCPKHGVALLDCCPKCEAPVIPHRVDMAHYLSKSMPATSGHTVCFQCGFSLQDAPTSAASARVIAWQKVMLEAIFEEKPVEVATVGPVPLLEYLAVARVWLTLLTFGRKAERLRELVSIPVQLETGVRGRSFDHLDVNTRLLAVEQLTILFEGWPDRVEAWAKAARLRRSTLLNDLDDPPKWYLEALRPLEYVNPRRSLESIDLEKIAQERGFSEQTLAILQGYAEGKSVRQLAKELDVSFNSIRWQLRSIKMILFYN